MMIMNARRCRTKSPSRHETIKTSAIWSASRSRRRRPKWRPNHPGKSYAIVPAVVQFALGVAWVAACKTGSKESTATRLVLSPHPTCEGKPRRITSYSLNRGRFPNCVRDPAAALGGGCVGFSARLRFARDFIVNAARYVAANKASPTTSSRIRSSMLTGMQ
jgi:hypothetical protein